MSSRPYSVLNTKDLADHTKKPGRYNDGRNLHLYVKPNGNATWIFRYRDRVTGKLRDKGLGPYGPKGPVTLAMARQKAEKCREMLYAGIDPIQFDRDELVAKKAANAKRLTFKQCFERFYKAKSQGWRNDKHAKQWINTIETYCGSILNKVVSEVDTSDVEDILLPIWLKKAETARRVRQRIEAVIDWAKVNKYYTGENPARLKGHLDKLLPAQDPNVEHRVAVPYDEIADFMAKLDGLQTLSAIALKLQILTATRPNEAVGADWSEFDLGKGLWTIPAARMKANRPHVVPLSAEAIAALKPLPVQKKGFLFPGVKGKSITTAAVLKLVKALYPKDTNITAHGFRSTFRDWAGAVTSHPTNIAEAALAHVLKDKTEAAYARDKLIEKRRLLMNDWADFCYGTPSKNISGS